MNLKFIKAGVLIHDNDKFLLVQEKAQRVYGLWNFPSGKVENELNVQQTAIKEVREETGFDVILEKELMVFEDTFPDTLKLYVFLGKVIGGSLMIPKDEILNAKWFSLEDIELMKGKLVGEWVAEAVRVGSN